MLTKRESRPLGPIGAISYGSASSTRFASPGFRRTTWRRRPGALPSCPVPTGGTTPRASAATSPQHQSFISHLRRSPNTEASAPTGRCRVERLVCSLFCAGVAYRLARRLGPLVSESFVIQLSEFDFPRLADLDPVRGV